MCEGGGAEGGGKAGPEKIKKFYKILNLSCKTLIAGW